MICQDCRQPFPIADLYLGRCVTCYDSRVDRLPLRALGIRGATGTQGGKRK